MSMNIAEDVAKKVWDAASRPEHCRWNNLPESDKKLLCERAQEYIDATDHVRSIIYGWEAELPDI